MFISGSSFFIPISLTVHRNDSHSIALFTVWLPLWFTTGQCYSVFACVQWEIVWCVIVNAFHTVVRKCAVRSAMEERLTSSILRCSRLIKF